MTKIAIIGAGLAGLTVANKLNHKFDITIFEKSRGVGGRMATRRAEPYYFDHGAQCFTIKTEEFKRFLQPLIDNGAVKIWQDKFVTIKNNRTEVFFKSFPRYVGAPAMNSIPKYLGENLNIKLNTQVQSLIKYNDHWQIVDCKNSILGEFDLVIVSTPAEQTKKLIPDNFKYYTEVKKAKMTGCLSIMLGFNNPINLGFSAAFIEDEDVSWIAINSNKPNRIGKTSVLINTTKKWSDEFDKYTKDEIIDKITLKASQLLNYNFNIAVHKAVHNWKYAKVATPTLQNSLFDDTLNTGICGDWCVENKVEGAFLSGVDLSDKILRLSND